MVSGLVSVLVSKATGLETLNIAKKWFSKICIFKQFLFVYLQVRNNENMSEKCQKFKKNELESDDHIFKILVK